MFNLENGTAEKLLSFIATNAYPMATASENMLRNYVYINTKIWKKKKKIPFKVHARRHC